ncbi:stage II sporulation protein M [Clostridium novyi]|uniref:Sporulation factor spoIIM, uncharacterized membrane protein n=1 Tax=Clostridium novyi (strain NT) TaxID=386415 RepID=A0Q0E5_CLONN|nr:stage II sporulation protein M [Clostridium novyi]ABK62190.1 sporulation factor spoIIM, uncharacterized membrane protein [Clostridium novyi NT]KEH85142.1 sporulation protein [Clostridium novyi A str. NCTC 538]KEH86171.1 sporulation protein [Clostridium novyi A str. BKT29909]
MKSKMVFGSLKDHIHKNLMLYMLTLLFLCIGIVIGMYTVKYMDKTDKNNLVEFLVTVTKKINPKNIDNKYVFLQAVKNNMMFILAIWFLGLTMLGTPIIFLTDLIKGFTIGFTSSLVINGLGAKGILLNLLIIFPQNIIYIPTIIILSVIACEFSLKMLKNTSHSLMDKNNNFKQIAKYSTVFLFITSFMLIGFVVEGYLSPSMIKLIASSVGCVIP